MYGLYGDVFSTILKTKHLCLETGFLFTSQVVLLLPLSPWSRSLTLVYELPSLRLSSHVGCILFFRITSLSKPQTYTCVGGLLFAWQRIMVTAMAEMSS
jgi:hypothetical protein